MRDEWYGDKRDLVKWGSLLNLADLFNAARIIQLAYHRPSEFGQLEIDGEQHDLPGEVISHFRNIRSIGSISSKIRVTVFDPELRERATHQQAVISLLPAFAAERCIVFLDPDTGLEPGNPTLKHVLAAEAASIWNAMKSNDVFAFYQHQDNRAGEPWIKPKQRQLAAALAVPVEAVKLARGLNIAHDVVIFYLQKSG